MQSGTLRRFGLEELHGFLTAVLCAPEMILPSEWLPVTLGEPEYQTTGQAQRITTFILRLYNEIAGTLSSDAQFVPLFMARRFGSGETELGANLWCRGFIGGMAMRDQIWRVGDGDDEVSSCLLPILALGGTSFENPFREYGVSRHDELVEVLPESVTTLYARMRRISSLEMQEPRTHANAAQPLPSYDAAQLAAWSVPELLEKMLHDEDRVPRNVIDELVRRGPETMRALLARLRNDDFWSEETSSGEWWLRLHTVMILGLLSGEEAGQLLVRLMCRMSEVEDENLQE